MASGNWTAVDLPVYDLDRVAVYNPVREKLFTTSALFFPLNPRYVGCQSQLTV